MKDFVATNIVKVQISNTMIKNSIYIRKNRSTVFRKNRSTVFLFYFNFLYDTVALTAFPLLFS